MLLKKIGSCANLYWEGHIMICSVPFLAICDTSYRLIVGIRLNFCFLTTVLTNSTLYNFWLKTILLLLCKIALSREAIDQINIKSHLNPMQFIAPPIKVSHIFKSADFSHRKHLAKLVNTLTSILHFAASPGKISHNNIN